MRFLKGLLAVLFALCSVKGQSNKTSLPYSSLHLLTAELGIQQLPDRMESPPISPTNTHWDGFPASYPSSLRSQPLQPVAIPRTQLAQSIYCTAVKSEEEGQPAPLNTKERKYMENFCCWANGTLPVCVQPSSSLKCTYSLPPTRAPPPWECIGKPCCSSCWRENSLNCSTIHPPPAECVYRWWPAKTKAWTEKMRLCWLRKPA
uniref:Uncharacterized protein n=1 Tax=Ditylenchus dipsaci TaxID=166011 RepID=A0A915EMW1_9BILA